MRFRRLPCWLAGAIAAAFAAQAARAIPPDSPGFGARESGFASLEEFTAQRRLEAGSQLRALSRDADRRNQERWLQSHGSPAEIEQYGRRVRSEDALDQLVDRQALARLPIVSDCAPFGPVTRRLLERSRIELRWIERRGDSEQRLRELEHAAATRASEAAGAFQTPGPLAPSP